MSAIIGALRGVLSLDSAAFDSGGKRAEASMGRLERRMNQFGRKMQAHGKKLSLTVTAPLAGLATVAVKSSLSVVDAQAKMAQSLGTSVASIQVLERAGDLAGVSMGEVEQATLQLTKRLSEVAATGKGPAVDALKVLRLNAEDLQKLPLDQRLATIQKAMTDLVPEAERASVATDLFGTRAGLTFTRIDTATLRIATEDVARFGIAVSEADADQIEITNDALSRLGLIGRGVGNQLAVAVAPALQSLADRAAQAAEWFNGLSDGSKTAVAVFGSIAAAAGPAAIGLGLVLKAAAPLAGAIAAIASPVGLAVLALGAVAVTAGVVYAKWDQLVERFPALGAAAELVGQAVEAARAVISSAWDHISTQISLSVEAITALLQGDFAGAFDAAGQIAANTGSAIIAGFAGIWAAVQPEIVALGATLQAELLNLAADGLTWAQGIAVQVGVGLSAMASEAVAAVQAMAAAIWAEIKAVAARALEEAKKIGQYIVDGIKAGINEQWEGLKKRVQEMADLLPEWLRKRLDIRSPSRVTKEIGGHVVDGLIVGMQDREDGLITQAQRLGDVLTDTLGNVSADIGDAIGSAVVGLGNGIEGVVQGVRSNLQRAFSDLVSQPIEIGLNGLFGLSSRSSSALGGGAAGGGNGLLNGLIGSQAGGLLSGGGLLGNSFLGQIGSGIGGVLSGGGLGSSFANLGGLVSGSVGGLGAIGAAIPALGIIAGVGVALSKAFSREYQFSGIRGNFDAQGFTGQGFDFHKGGAFRSDKTDYYPLDPELEALLDTQARALNDSIHQMADVLLLDKAILDGFVSDFVQVNTNQDQEKILADLTAELEKSGEKMAQLVLGSAEFVREGETALDTITRLSTGFVAVNDVMDLLGHRVFDVGLIGANAASELADAFGGLDALTTAANTYWSAFYSESERQETTLRRLTDQFADLGLAMPRSREQFRQLVEGLDVTTERGQALYAQLLQISGAMAEVLPQVAQFTLEMTGILDTIGGEVGSMLATARDNARVSSTAARLWYRTTDTMRDFMSGLVNSNLSVATSQQALTVNRSRFETAFELARGGDVEAARDIPNLAKALLNSELANASSAVEYRRIAAQVQGQVKFLAGLSELEGANQDVLTTLYEQQIQVLTNLGNFLQLEGLTNDQIGELDASIQNLARDFDGTLAEFDTALGSLETAIKEAELFSYDYLKERLKVTVDLLPTATISPWMQTLITQSAEGITSHIDFIVRSELPPPEKWLAVNAASEHIKSLDFIVRNPLARDTRLLALETTSELRKNVRFFVTRALDADTRKIALAGNSELSRTVNVALDELGSDSEALRLALRGVGDYAVAVTGSLHPGISDAVRRIVVTRAGGYAAIVNAAIMHMQGAGRRILLEQQGTYTANITGILLASVPENVKRLLLDANTAGVRAVTIAGVYADSLSAADRALLVEEGTTALRTIQAQVNPLALSPIGVQLLDQLTFGTGEIARGIRSNFASNVDAQDGLLLRQLGFGDGIVDRSIFSNFASRVDAQDAKLLVQLGRGDGTTFRNLKSFFASNPDAWAARFIPLLEAGNGTISRGIWSNFASNVDPQDALMLRQLEFGNGTTDRSIWSNFGSNVDKMDARLLAQLEAGKGTIERIIRGRIDLANLNTQQRALLDSITGATSGTITLAGTYTFTPEAAFQKWYGDVTQSYIQNPMTSLRGAIVALREEIAGQRLREEQKQAAISGISGAAGSYLNQLSENRNWAQNLVNKVKSLQQQTGTHILDAAGNAAHLYVGPDGKIQFNGASIAGGNIQAFAQAFYGQGGLNDYMSRANTNIGFIEGKLATARQQVVSLGGVPSFDGGGFTGIGSRSGGLDGKGGFIAMLHPQETVLDHTKPGPGFGVGPLLAELQAMRRELADIKRLNVRTASNTQDTSDRLLVLERQT